MSAAHAAFSVHLPHIKIPQFPYHSLYISPINHCVNHPSITCQSSTIHLSIAHQSPVNHLPIIYHSPVNHLPIVHHSPANHLPIIHHSPVNHPSITCQSPANHPPFTCQSPINHLSISSPRRAMTTWSLPRCRARDGRGC